MSVRTPPEHVFTPQQKLVLAMIGNNMTYTEIARRLHIDWETVRDHAQNAAAKIPGDLPTRTRIHFWIRGATEDQLTGEGWVPELKLT